MFNSDFYFQYSPILSISPAEMTALQELPEKDKDLLLPVFPLKGWVGSKTLDKSLDRIEKAFGDRQWIADIDSSFLAENRDYLLTGEYPRSVFYELESLLDPNDGYRNWVSFVSERPNIIPVLQAEDLSEISAQIFSLSALERGLVLRFSILDIDSGKALSVMELVRQAGVKDLFIILDYGKIAADVLEHAESVVADVYSIASICGEAVFSISASSFPDGFSGYREGEHTIYERLLYNRVVSQCSELKFVYSDRGGARAESLSGGAGVPSPRIDYPLENEWKFIRVEFEDSSAPKDGEKENLYTQIAIKMLNKDYWNPELALWGKQIIEFTSKGDSFGINSAAKSTAVRLNIHMHQQLHYHDPKGLLDTDEDWED